MPDAQHNVKDTAKPGFDYMVTAQVRIPNSSDPTGDSDVWRIDFKTAAGTGSYIQVPQAQYNAEHVAKLLADAAAHIVAVDKLVK